MKTFFVLLAFLAPALAWSADNILCSPSGSACQLIDASGNHWNAKIGFTTDGNGDIFTLGDVASTDNILGQNPSGNRTLIDNSSRRWSASVLYTTDGHGNVIPVPAGGGGGGVTSVTASSPLASSGGTTPNITLPGPIPSTLVGPLPYLPLAGGTMAGTITMGANNAHLNSDGTANFFAASFGIGAAATFDANGNLNTSGVITAGGAVTISSDTYSSVIISSGGNDVAIGGNVTAPDDSSGTAVGAGSNGSSGGTAVGYGSYGPNSGAAVGSGSDGSSDGAAVGVYADGDTYGAAVGYGSNGYNGGAAVGALSNGYNGGAAVGAGSNTNNINGAVAIGGDANDIYPATIPGGFTLPTVQIGQGTAVLNGGLNYGTGLNVYPVMDTNGIFQVKVQGSGTTPTSTTPGSIAFTSAYILCVYNGSGWVQAATGATSCVF